MMFILKIKQEDLLGAEIKYHILRQIKIFQKMIGPNL